ncbi:hypothetical protein Q4530_01085 [Colwellia sp. 1_MG-2023]|uniref:glycine-rich domain-containing protein n=1 Tax=unclassified Colwellia TaxID=196834 RepID=UPI0020901A4D|nr:MULTISPECIES: hypothetical protein [unclassified Colwellia]MDO6650961.1 hypothetical protein [Colwellia sp. 3_MG-2023]MDO6663996.1 hypothetical protein [Colwellia sp. 2_MG-2023]MDO6688347.1 hypothetical protein [Colwellia sp. 1_MG-2023]
MNLPSQILEHTANTKHFNHQSLQTVDISIHPLVKSINFDKLKWKLTKSAEATWTDKLCDLAELEYQKFLSLKLLYPKVSLVPSKLVDKFWHEHILDTKSYEDDCNKVFGYFVHHYPYFGIYGKDDQNALQVSFDKTIELYEMHFGKYPTKALFGSEAQQASRCGGHACHVPSTCACRTPSACK